MTQDEAKDWRVKCSWGDGGASYFYFATGEAAAEFYPDPKPIYGTFSGRLVGHKRPLYLTIQRRGPRNGWSADRRADRKESQS